MKWGRGRGALFDRFIPYIVFLVGAAAVGIVTSPLISIPLFRLGLSYNTILAIYAIVPVVAVWFTGSVLCAHRRTPLYSRASVGAVLGLILGFGIIAASYVMLFGLTRPLVPAAFAALFSKLQHDKDLRQASLQESPT